MVPVAPRLDAPCLVCSIIYVCRDERRVGGEVCSLSDEYQLWTPCLLHHWGLLSFSDVVVFVLLYRRWKLVGRTGDEYLEGEFKPLIDWIAAGAANAE